MKKNLLLLATIFYITTSVVIPLAGFAFLKPSVGNMLLISMLFVLSVFGATAYSDLWIRERRRIMNETNSR